MEKVYRYICHTYYAYYTDTHVMYYIGCRYIYVIYIYVVCMLHIMYIRHIYLYSTEVLNRYICHVYDAYYKDTHVMYYICILHTTMKYFMMIECMKNTFCALIVKVHHSKGHTTSLPVGLRSQPSSFKSCGPSPVCTPGVVRCLCMCVCVRT